MNCNYLAFEGIDGSGKTTFIDEVSLKLTKLSTDFKIVRNKPDKRGFRVRIN